MWNRSLANGIALVLLCTQFCFGQSYWTGAGTTNHFHLPANWTAGVPGSVDTAYFGVPGGFLVDIDMNTVVDSLRVEDGSPEFIGGNAFVATFGSYFFPGTSTTFFDVSSLDFGSNLRVYNGINVPGELIITNNIAAEAGATVIEGRLLVREATLSLFSFGTLPDQGNAHVQFDENAQVDVASYFSLNEYNGNNSRLILNDAQMLAQTVHVDGGQMDVFNNGIVQTMELEVDDRGELNLADGGCIMAADLILDGGIVFDPAVINVFGAGNMILANISNFAALGEVNVFGELNATTICVDDEVTILLSDGTIVMDTIETSGIIRFDSGVNSITADVMLHDAGGTLGLSRLTVISSAIASIDGQFRHDGDAVWIFPDGVLRLLGEVDGHGPYVGEGKVAFFDKFKPGNTDYAVVAFENTVEFKTTSNIFFQVDGFEAGINHDQLQITGELDLNGQLTLGISGEYLAGDTITLIEVDGSSSGNFLGYAEGAIFNENGLDMSITYVGGDGNDVDLVVLESSYVLGDVNLDGNLNLLDVDPFIAAVSNGIFQLEADINRDGEVDLLDVGPLIQLLGSG